MFGWPASNPLIRTHQRVMAGDPRRTALCGDLRTSGPPVLNVLIVWPKSQRIK